LLPKTPKPHSIRKLIIPLKYISINIHYFLVTLLAGGGDTELPHSSATDFLSPDKSAYPSLFFCGEIFAVSHSSTIAFFPLSAEIDVFLPFDKLRDF